MTDKKRKAVYNPEAAKRWDDKNRDYRNYLSRRSNARGFIRTKATEEDLIELRQMIDERIEELKKPTD